MSTPSLPLIALALVAAIVTTTDAQPRRGWYYLFGSATEEPVLVGPWPTRKDCQADQLDPGRSRRALAKWQAALETASLRLGRDPATWFVLSEALERAGVEVARWTECEEMGR